MDVNKVHEEHYRKLKEQSYSDLRREDRRVTFWIVFGLITIGIPSVIFIPGLIENIFDHYNISKIARSIIILIYSLILYRLMLGHFPFLKKKRN